MSQSVDHEPFIRRAIALAREATAAGNAPFGALLARDGQIILEARNTVYASHSPLAHAETELLRAAHAALSAEVLAQCTLYTSTEPCPMCAGAIFWSRVPTVVFGCSVARLATLYTGSDLTLNLPCADVFARGGGHTVTVVGPVLEDEAAAVHLTP